MRAIEACSTTTRAPLAFCFTPHTPRGIPVVGDLSSRGTLPRIGTMLCERRRSLSVPYASYVKGYPIRDGRFAAYALYVARLASQPESFIVCRWFGGPGLQPASVPGYYKSQ